jgi:KilA-N domain
VECLFSQVIGIKYFIPYICGIKPFSIMAKNRQIEVKGIVVTISERNNDDFISLTDVANGFDGGYTLVEKWIRNKNTIEFLAVWEQLNNPNFNSPEFGGIRNEAGTNRFVMSAKQWIERTNAIGIIASAGRYGGTYAHKDIALEFCSWLSPEFKLLLIKEFQRLKIDEAERVNSEWDIKRMVSKANYRIHTDAIKEKIVPNLTSENQKNWIYSEEADVLNLILFGKTAKQWKQENPSLVLQGGNIRDYADLHQLTVLSNLESINALLIKQGVEKKDRLIILHQTAVEQTKSLQSLPNYTLDKLKSPNLKLVEQKSKKG